jgi:hypothetical protein
MSHQHLADLRSHLAHRAWRNHLREEATISAYFTRISRSWPKELEAFLNKLDSFL